MQKMCVENYIFTASIETKNITASYIYIYYSQTQLIQQSGVAMILKAVIKSTMNKSSESQQIHSKINVKIHDRTVRENRKL